MNDTELDPQAAYTAAYRAALSLPDLPARPIGTDTRLRRDFSRFKRQVDDFNRGQVCSDHLSSDGYTDVVQFRHRMSDFYDRMTKRYIDRTGDVSVWDLHGDFMRWSRAFDAAHVKARHDARLAASRAYSIRAQRAVQERNSYRCA